MERKNIGNKFSYVQQTDSTLFLRAIKKCVEAVICDNPYAEYDIKYSTFAANDSQIFSALIIFKNFE